MHAEFRGNCVVPQGLFSHDITNIIRTLLVILIETSSGGLEQIGKHFKNFKRNEHRSILQIFHVLLLRYDSQRGQERTKRRRFLLSMVYRISYFVRCGSTQCGKCGQRREPSKETISCNNSFIPTWNHDIMYLKPLMSLYNKLGYQKLKQTSMNLMWLHTQGSKKVIYTVLREPTRNPGETFGASCMHQFWINKQGKRCRFPGLRWQKEWCCFFLWMICQR